MSLPLLGEEEKKPATAPSSIGLPTLGEDTAVTSKVRPVVTAALNTNADQAAEARRLGRDLGVPSGTVEMSLDPARQQARAERLGQLMSRSPELTRWLSDPENAKVGHADAENLDAAAGIVNKGVSPRRVLTQKEFAEEVRKTWKSSPALDLETARQLTAARFTVVPEGTPTIGPSPEQGFFERRLDDLRRGAAMASQTVTTLASELGLYKNAQPELGVTMAQKERRAGAFPRAPELQRGLESISKATTMSEAVGAALRNPEAVLSVTTESFASSSPALAAALAGSVVGPVGTGVGAAAGSFAIEYASTIREVLAERGLNANDPMAYAQALNDPEIMSEARAKAGKRGIAIALFDGLTAGLAGKLLMGAKPTVSSVASRVAGEQGLQAGGGAAGEFTAQALTGEYKPGDILLEALAEIPGGLVEVYGNVRTAREAAFQTAGTAEQDAKNAEMLLAAATASKVRKNDAETFQQFMQNAAADGPVQEVYVDARTFAQAAGDKLELMKQEMPSVGAQIDEAVQLGKDLVIPVGEFAAKLPETGLEQAMLDHVRLKEDMPSRAEAQAQLAEAAAYFQQEAERLTAQAQADDTMRQSQLAVETDVLRQFTEANRWTKDVNVAYAKYTAALFATQAARLTKAGQPTTPEQMYQQFALKVSAQSIAGENELDQTTPEFQQWSEGSAVRNPDGSMMRVTHYTNKDFTEFRTKSSELGAHFATDVSQSNAFVVDSGGVIPGAVTIPAYLSIKNPLRLVDFGGFGYSEVWPQLVDLGIMTEEQAKAIEPLKREDRLVALQSVIKAAGYDGVVYLNRREGTEFGPTDWDRVDTLTDEEYAAESPNARDSYIAFEPNQIKSVFNARPTDDPNIMLQSAALRRGTETLKRFGLEPGKRYTTRQVAEALERRQRQKYGTIALDDRSPEAARKIARWMVDEVLFELEHPENSGLGWYGERFQRAIDAFAVEFPELATDQTARDMFTLFVAITSNGADVFDNFRAAAGVYANFKRTGKFELDRGLSRPETANILARAQKLYDELGPEEMKAYLLTKRSIKELKAEAREMGEELNTGYPVNMTMPISALVLGPKLGAFYANLMGQPEHLTMDRWWSRMFNRYRGQLLDRPTQAGIERVRGLLREAFVGPVQPGQPELTDDEVLFSLKPYVDAYKAKGFKNGTELEKAANTLYKAAFENLRDAPENASDREFMVRAARQAVSNLKRRGIEITPADLQAVLWYYEKRLYRELGTTDSGSYSYEDAARAVARERGADAQPGGPAAQELTSRGLAGGEEAFVAEVAPSELPGARAFNQPALAPELERVANPPPPAAKADFRGAAIKDILAKSNWAILTAENPEAKQLPAEENAARMDALKAALKQAGLEYIEVTGRYGENDENSIVVLGITQENALALGRAFGQESVLTRAGLVYKDGSINPARGVTLKPEGGHTLLPDGTTFAVDIDFDNRWPAQDGRVGEITVAGVHFSKQSRTRLEASAHGTGLKGAERERGAGKRVHFYVNTGKGVTPEPGVGQSAHIVKLTNLYDADSDLLGLWTGTTGLNEKEAAVAAAGFSGYFTRNFGDQGAAVSFDSVNVAPVGTAETANEKVANVVPPAAQYTERRKAAIEFVKDPRLPSGQMTGPEWLAEIKRVSPDLAAKIPEEVFAGVTTPVYKDELVRSFNQPAAAANRGQITFGNDITATPSIITLLKKADLSTYLHELGHFYLEMMTHIASQPGAPIEIVNDMEKTLRWFGLSGGIAQWNSMSLEQKRPYHEQFARGHEAYLFEGKAPSQELQGTFSRFGAWLKNVYRDLTALNVELTDEVRGVFDRMIATEEQIKEQEAARAFAPLFKTAEEMGATPEEWAAYQRSQEEASEAGLETLQTRGLRNMQWLNNARGRELRKLQREAADKRKAVEADIRAEVAAQPVYAAQNFLRYGVLPEQKFNNAQRALLDDMAGTKTKLSLAALKEMYGEGPAAPWRYFATGKDGMVATDGVHPDQVAPLFGFSSGDAMVRAILAAEPMNTVVEGMTDQRMLERYGDMTNPDEMQRAADEAVVNGNRLRVLATELAATRGALGKWRVLNKAAKDFATTLVERKKIKDIKPNQYRTAAARAAKAAEAAAGLTEKATEKRNQLVNSHAERAAMDAQDYVSKQVAYLRKFDNEGTRKALDPEYLDQIDQILERVELRAVTQTTLKKRASLLSWIEAQEEAGFEPVVDQKLIDEARQVNYRELTLEDFRALVDSVRNIEHLGRLKQKLLTAKDAREFAAVVQDMQASIAENANREAKVRIETGRGVGKLGKIARGFVAMHRKFASIAREMDGGKDGGTMWERLIRPMNEAGDKEVSMRAEGTKKLAELFKLLDGSKLSRKTEVFPGVSLTREAQIMFALNWGNEGNRQRALDGGLDGRTPLQPAQAEAILNGLTSKEWDFVEAVWDFVADYRAEIAAQEKRLTGVEPKWVEPSPFTLPNGRTIKGGYFPAKYDGELSTRSNELEAVTDLRQQMMGAAGRAATRNGYTKARANEVKGRPLRKDFGVIFQHVGEVIHRLSWQDYLTDARRLLNSKAIDSTIREHYGPEILREMKEQLKDIAAGDLGAQSDWDRILGHLRSGVTIAGMGWNISTALLQPFGATQSIVRIGAPWFARGLVHFATNPLSAGEKARAKSKFMETRALQLNRDFTDILNRIDNKAMSNVEASYFWMIYKMQSTVDIPTWWGAYEKAIAEGNDDARSVALADQAVLDAQGGGHLKDQSRIQRGGQERKLFTAFYSFFSTTYNLAVEQGRTAGVKGGMAIPKLASDYLMLFTIPALAGAVLKMLLKGEDWDDEEAVAKKLLAEQLSYMFGTMVLLREIGGGITAAAGGYNYSGPASLRLLVETAKLAKQASQGEIDAAAMKAANNVAGILLHYPAGQVQRTVEGMVSFYEGESDNPLVLLTGPSRE